MHPRLDQGLCHKSLEGPLRCLTSKALGSTAWASDPCPPASSQPFLARAGVLTSSAMQVTHFAMTIEVLCASIPRGVALGTFHQEPLYSKLGRQVMMIVADMKTFNVSDGHVMQGRVWSLQVLPRGKFGQGLIRPLKGVIRPSKGLIRSLRAV